MFNGKGVVLITYETCVDESQRAESQDLGNEKRIELTKEIVKHYFFKKSF